MAASAAVIGANDRIRLGIIGPGARGQEVMKDALACPNVEFVGAADVYTARLEEAKAIAPGIKTYLDHRYLLEDSSIDAVIIATPQHLHARHFTDSLAAGKHVYQEKTMAFQVEHAKQMRAAFRKAGKRAVQIGHQGTSGGAMIDARRLLGEQPMGQVTAIHMVMYRNTPHGQPQWSRQVKPDMTPEKVMWKQFLGDAPDRPFDANRYLNWRFYWDYSGGNVYENMCHQVAFWYKALEFTIPKAVTMTGGVYLWKDGREVPDTMCVTLEQPAVPKTGGDCLISWNSGFGNSNLGSAEDVLGTDGTLRQARGQTSWNPERVNVKDKAEVRGTSKTASNAHMLNFCDAIRTGAELNCPFDLGFRTAIACRMAVDSYRQGRTMKWDPAREEIV
jgi:predicted dehydrogenase